MRKARLLVMSAATSSILEEVTTQIHDKLETLHDKDFADLVRGLRSEQETGPYRRTVVAADPRQAARRLAKQDPLWVHTSCSRPDRPLVWMFAGVGDHYPGLAADLYLCLPRFRERLDHCFETLRVGLGVDLHDVLYPDGVRPAVSDGNHRTLDLAAVFDLRDTTQEIHRTRVAQPLVFAVQYALAEAVRAMGVSPTAVLGYSVGEYVAACVAGVLPVDSALRLIAARAGMMAELPEGAMLAVMAGAPDIAGHIDERVSLAAVDGPELTVLAGTVDAITNMSQVLAGEGIASKRLAASHAFHSPMMEPVVEPLRRMVGDFELRPPRVPLLSNVTGTWLTDREATDPGYWARHVRQPIRFADDLSEVWALTSPILIEFGPGPALSRLATRHPDRPADDSALLLRTLPGPFESNSAQALLLNMIGRLWATGIDVDWSDVE